jgi:hypothetical protein
MTPDEATRQSIEARHYTTSDPDIAEGPFCAECGSMWPWPCDVRLVLDLTTTDHPDVRAGLAQMPTDRPWAIHRFRDGRFLVALYDPGYENAVDADLDSAIAAALSTTSEPTCWCGGDAGQGGARFDIVCPKHD